MPVIHAFVTAALGTVTLAAAVLQSIGAGDAARSGGDPAPSAAEQPRWAWPTDAHVITRPWDAPATDYSAGHRGIDVAADLGTPVTAVDGGVVSFAGSVGGRPVVSIDHGDGLVSTLDSVEPTVSAGAVVAVGQAIGRVAVGHCPASEPCVHLGARLDDRYVDPTPFLSPADWPILLPESAWTG